MKEIVIVGVPMRYGQSKFGVDMGPIGIRYANLQGELELLEYVVTDSGNITIGQSELDAQNSNLKNLEIVIDVNKKLQKEVSQIVSEGKFPLVLGGDHSIAIGTISGIAQHYQDLGVIWFDAHGDVNTDVTTPSGNIHGMSLAVLLGYGDKRLVKIGDYAPKLNPRNVVLIGTRSLDEGEVTFIKEKGIKMFTMDDIDKVGMATVMEEVIFYLSHCDGIHVSIDLDGLDPSIASGVGTPINDGMTSREGHLIMRKLAESDKVVSAELVEVNPLLDNNNQTAKIAVDLVATLLGKNVTMY